jgi:hypothetical protein
VSAGCSSRVRLLGSLLLAAWNLVTYWLLWMAVTPGLRWTQAMALAQSGTAVTNTVPGGSGIGVGLAYAMVDSWGFSRARSTLAVLVTGGVEHLHQARPARARPGPDRPRDRDRRAPEAVTMSGMRTVRLSLHRLRPAAGAAAGRPDGLGPVA